MAVQRRKRRMRGGGWREVWERVKSAGREGHDFLKREKVISRFLEGSSEPYLKAAAPFAKRFGYGRRRMHGGRIGGPVFGTQVYPQRFY